jgi:hypothetical protein
MGILAATALPGRRTMRRRSPALTFAGSEIEWLDVSPDAYATGPKIPGHAGAGGSVVVVVEVVVDVVVDVVVVVLDVVVGGNVVVDVVEVVVVEVVVVEVVVVVSTGIANVVGSPTMTHEVIRSDVLFHTASTVRDTPSTVAVEIT